MNDQKLETHSPVGNKKEQYVDIQEANGEGERQGYMHRQGRLFTFEYNQTQVNMRVTAEGKTQKQEVKPR